MPEPDPFWASVSPLWQYTQTHQILRTAPNCSLLSKNAQARTITLTITLTHTGHTYTYIHTRTHTLTHTYKHTDTHP